jgi:hypothetical protein
MDTKWLEDFVSLAETGSFSRTAQLRHVTQPAFSRRIQSLEAWAGADLVDRSSYPTRPRPCTTSFARGAHGTASRMRKGDRALSPPFIGYSYVAGPRLYDKTRVSCAASEVTTLLAAYSSVSSGQLSTAGSSKASSACAETRATSGAGRYAAAPSQQLSRSQTSAWPS